MILNSNLCVGKRQVNYQLFVGKSMAALGVIICIVWSILQSISFAGIN